MSKVRITLATKKLDNSGYRLSRKWHIKAANNEQAFCGREVESSFQEAVLECYEYEVCAVCLRKYAAYCSRHDFGSPYFSE